MSAPSTSGLSVELVLHVRVIDVKYGYFTLSKKTSQVKSPETRVMLRDILSHAARNFIECINLKKSNNLRKSQGINS